MTRSTFRHCLRLGAPQSWGTFGLGRLIVNYCSGNSDSYAGNWGADRVEVPV